MSEDSAEPMVDIHIRCGRGDVMPLAAFISFGSLVLAEKKDEPMLFAVGEELSDDLVAALTGESPDDLSAHFAGFNEVHHTDPDRGVRGRYDVRIDPVEEAADD